MVDSRQLHAFLLLTYFGCCRSIVVQHNENLVTIVLSFVDELQHVLCEVDCDVVHREKLVVKVFVPVHFFFDFFFFHCFVLFCFDFLVLHTDDFDLFCYVRVLITIQSQLR